MTVHPSTCQGCASYCSVLVEEENGRIIRVKGNPANLATGGAVCPALQITLQQQSDPDRVTVPLRRCNPKKGRAEDPRFEPITWDDALNEIAERMLDLRSRGVGERLAITRGRCTSINGLLFKVLPDIFGTPNRITHDGICAEAEKLATGALDGIWDYHDHDFEHAECVVLWGTDPVVSNRFKSVACKVFPKLGQRARIFAVSPHRSLTAERVREESWVPIIPGTDGALALAMAHVVLVEGIWSRTYVGDFTDGANRFKQGCEVDEGLFVERGTRGLVCWWNLELRHRTPSWASELCGVPPQRIEEMARSLAAAGGRGISWVSPGVTMTERGVASGMACHALNALVGSVDCAGGVMRLASTSTVPLPSTDSYQDVEARRANGRETADGRLQRGCMAARADKIHANHLTNQLADAILAGEPYPIEMMIGYWNNFAFSCSETDRWERALSKLPFFVHVTTNLSETSQFADIVLPAKNHLYESWGYTVSRMRGRACVSLQVPSIVAPGACKGDETELPFMLAQKLAEKGFPALLDYYRESFPNEDGSMPGSGEELGRNAVRLMTRPMWERRGSWEDFCECGVVCSEKGSVPRREPSEEPLPLSTPSGCFELESSVVRRMLGEYAAVHGISAEDAVAELGYSCSPELLAFPHWEEPPRVGDDGDFPLVFSQHRAFASLEGRSANTELFQKMKAVDPGDEAWDDVLKVHPRDLEQAGIADGELVVVESPVGSGIVRVRAWDGVLPGVVSKCYGQGHWAYGHIAARDFENHMPRGFNANELMPAVYEPMTGATARHGGPVRIRLRPLGSESPGE